MKTLVTLTVLSLASIAMAKTSELSCSFPSLSKSAKFFITVDGLGSENVSLNYDTYTDYEGEEAAFSYKGEELEDLWMTSLSWDGQSVRLDKKGNLVFDFDSDGCDVGKLYLYENSGFKKGYLKMEHNCSGPDEKGTYSKAYCNISDK